MNALSLLPVIIQIATFVALVVLIILYLVGKFSLPSYLQEKGKNLATKQDIAAITDSIEKVRTNYATQTEQLKADLNLLIGYYARLQEQKNEALTQFFDDCSVLLVDKLSTNFGELPIDHGKSLFEYQNSVNALFTRLYTDYHRVLLYFADDTEVTEAASQLVNSATVVHRIFKRRFGMVKMALIEETQSYESGDNTFIRTKAATSDGATKEYYAEITGPLEKLRADFGKYLTALNNYFTKRGHKTALESLRSLASEPPTT